MICQKTLYSAASGAVVSRQRNAAWFRRHCHGLTSVSSRGMTLTELVTSSPVTVTKWQFCSSEVIGNWPSFVIHECTCRPPSTYSTDISIYCYCYVKLSQAQTNWLS